MEDLQDKIIELMDLFDGEVTTLDKINPPEPRKDVQDIEAINRFMRDNPPGMAGGGMLVQPSADGSRPGYAKQKQKFISGPGTKTTALDDPKKYKIVKKYLNKVKTQKNKRIFLDWSEQIGSKPNPWYEKLKGEVKLTRQPLNELINKVIAEEFPTAYSGRAGKVEYAREMTVKSFINYWNQNGMFDGNEKLSKPLEQFVTTKKGANNYENINRYFTQWKEGKFEVDGVDRKNLDKGLLQAIKKWNPSVKGARSNLVKAQLIYLNNLSPNLSYDRVANLFAQKFPDSAQTLQHRLNQLTELKRNGVYNDGTGNPKKIPGIEIGERSGWLKEGYGKGFLGNYGRLVKKADELMAAGETKFAKRLYNAADKFFSPTGIFTKAAGEGEHPLSRNMGDGPIGNQLKINSLVSGDLNQFKKFNFDSPVRNLVLEYENPNTTSARKKEIKLEIENRKKLMNILTEGPNQKGIVDSVKFNYGSNKISASVDVPDIDKIKNFDINEFITRGEEYRKSVLDKGREVGLISNQNQIIKQTLDSKKVENLLAKIGCPGKGKVAAASGGRIQFQDGLSPEVCMTRGADVIKEKRIDSPAQKANFNKMMKIASVGKNMALLKDVLGPYGLGGDVLLEGMIAVNKTLTGGTPFKEAWQDSWLSNIVGGAYDEAGQKLGRQKLFELRSGLSSGAQEFGDYNRKVEEYYKLIEQRNNLEAMSGGGAFDYVGNLAGDVRQINNKIKVAERELGRMETRINAQGGFDAIENEYNRKTAERTDADAATSLQSIGRRFVEDNQLNEMLRDDFSGLSSDALPMQRPDRTPLTSYRDFKPDLPTLDEYKKAYGDLAKEFNIVPPNEQQMQQEINQEKFRQLFNQPGFMGASDTFFGDSINMADGGRAGFTGGGYGKDAAKYIKEIETDHHKGYQYYKKHGGKKSFKQYMKESMSKYFAGGGIAKLAGVDQGPPPESGPNSQGLQGLLNRVKNI